MKKLLLILFVLALIPVVHAQISLSSFTASPSQISAGEQVQLRLNLDNVGSEDIKNILISLDLSQVPFAPIDSSTETVIDEIKNDDSKVVYFNLIALPNAEPLIYKIPVGISYNTTIKTALISLEVIAYPKLDLLLDNSEVVKIGDNGKVTLKFVNNGLTQIKFLKVTLQPSLAYEILSSSELYIGQVDIDDFQTEEFTIIPKIKNPQLTFNVEYTDNNNNKFTETKTISLNVYTEEEAKQLGLTKTSSFTSIIVIVVIIILAIIIYRRIKKRKKNVT